MKKLLIAAMLLLCSATWSKAQYEAGFQGGAGAPALISQDEGGACEAATATMNFVGAGVTCAGGAGTATITIPGGGGSLELPVLFQVAGINDATQGVEIQTLTITSDATGFAAGDRIGYYAVTDEVTGVPQIIQLWAFKDGGGSAPGFHSSFLNFYSVATFSELAVTITTGDSINTIASTVATTVNGQPNVTAAAVGAVVSVTQTNNGDVINPSKATGLLTAVFPDATFGVTQEGVGPSTFILDENDQGFVFVIGNGSTRATVRLVESTTGGGTMPEGANFYLLFNNAPAYKIAATYGDTIGVYGSGEHYFQPGLSQNNHAPVHRVVLSDATFLGANPVWSHSQMSVNGPAFLTISSTGQPFPRIDREGAVVECQTGSGDVDFTLPFLDIMTAFHQIGLEKLTVVNTGANDCRLIAGTNQQLNNVAGPSVGFVIPPAGNNASGSVQLYNAATLVNSQVKEWAVVSTNYAQDQFNSRKSFSGTVGTLSLAPGVIYRMLNSGGAVTFTLPEIATTVMQGRMFAIEFENRAANTVTVTPSATDDILWNGTTITGATDLIALSGQASTIWDCFVADSTEWSSTDDFYDCSPRIQKVQDLVDAGRAFSTASPAINAASCGTGGAIPTGQSDYGFQVNLGTTAGTTCTVDFDSTWQANSPVCTATLDDATIELAISALSTTQITFTGGADFSSTTIYATCEGRKN